jgi:hypothetical protein
MNENKPIIFINSPQSHVTAPKEQTVFDSRMKPIALINERQSIIEETDVQKLQHKIELLDKRAKSEHFVLVEVTTNQQAYEGLFKGRLDTVITIFNEQEEIAILIKDIVDIKILKV